jgi:chromosome segregation ATPase
MYKFVKRLFVAVLIVIAACFALKKANVDCGPFQKVVDFVGTPSIPNSNGEGELGKLEDLIKKLNAHKAQLQRDLVEANKTVEQIAQKLDEWRKDINSGETYANLLCEVIDIGDYPATVLDKTFDSEQDVKATFESVLSQLQARQASSDEMKTMYRDATRERDLLIKQVADYESKIVQAETALAQRKRDEREEIDVDAELRKMDSAKSRPAFGGTPDLSTLTELLVEEEKKIEEAGKKRLEDEQREKQFEEYYVKYQMRLKTKNKTVKSESKTRSDFELSSEDKED